MPSDAEVVCEAAWALDEVVGNLLEVRAGVSDLKTRECLDSLIANLNEAEWAARRITDLLERNKKGVPHA